MNPVDHFYTVQLAELTAGHRLGPVLWDFERVPATADQFEVICRVTTRARELGLRLPRGLTVTFVDASEVTSRGQARQAPDGISVWLRSDVPPQELPHLLFHELQHAHDMHARTFAGMSIVQRETLAIAFAQRAMQSWSW